MATQVTQHFGDSPVLTLHNSHFDVIPTFNICQERVDKYAQDILSMEPFDVAFLDGCVNIFLFIWP